jgi:hypothetical protein
MSEAYSGVAKLRADETFLARVHACEFAQAATFTNDGREDIKSLADTVLRGTSPVTLDWSICDAPGFGDKADDSTAITDPDLTSATQAVWPTVAGLLYPAAE